MIEIVITQIRTEEYKETVNFLIHKQPTTVKYTEYSSEKIAYEETNEPREIAKTREVKRTLLTQHIDDESLFDLAAVVSAVNHLGGK